MNLINRSYDALIDSVYVALAKQTRLAAYMDQIELSFVNGQMTYDFAPLTTKLDTTFAADKPNALIDLAELLRYNGDSLRDAAWFDSGIGKLRGWADALRRASNIRTGVCRSGTARGCGRHGWLAKPRWRTHDMGVRCRDDFNATFETTRCRARSA